MGSKKDSNGMDLTEAEDIKKRWQEYTEELYKKDLHNQDNHNGLISSLSHSIVFLYLFSLITEEGFLISPCCSLELCIQWVYLSFSALLLASILFRAICKASSDSHFAFLHFFLLGMVLIPISCKMSRTSLYQI